MVRLDAGHVVRMLGLFDASEAPRRARLSRLPPAVHRQAAEHCEPSAAGTSHRRLSRLFAADPTHPRREFSILPTLRPHVGHWLTRHDVARHHPDRIDQVFVGGMVRRRRRL